MMPWSIQCHINHLCSSEFQSNNDFLKNEAILDLILSSLFDWHIYFHARILFQEKNWEKFFLWCFFYVLGACHIGIQWANARTHICMCMCVSFQSFEYFFVFFFVVVVAVAFRCRCFWTLVRNSVFFFFCVLIVCHWSLTKCIHTFMHKVWILFSFTQQCEIIIIISMRFDGLYVNFSWRPIESWRLHAHTHTHSVYIFFLNRMDYYSLRTRQPLLQDWIHICRNHYFKPEHFCAFFCYFILNFSLLTTNRKFNEKKKKWTLSHSQLNQNFDTFRPRFRSILALFSYHHSTDTRLYTILWF